MKNTAKKVTSRDLIIWGFAVTPPLQDLGDSLARKSLAMKEEGKKPEMITSKSYHAWKRKMGEEELWGLPHGTSAK